MAFQFSLPVPLASAGWKVKIRDQERLEPPHVTILRKTDAWRWNLRTRQFMDQLPDPSLVPKSLVDELRAHYPKLCETWNRMYPTNRVNEPL